MNEPDPAQINASNSLLPNRGRPHMNHNFGPTEIPTIQISRVML